MFTMLSIASTASSAERPLSGAAAACAEMPWNRNFAPTFASVLLGLAALRSPGCQVTTTSTSSNMPSRTMYTLPEPPSSAGVP